MKRVRLAVAVVLTAAMLAGGTVMAAGSPSSTTTAVTASTSSASTETTAVTENWIPRAHGYQAVKQVRFTSDYIDTEKGTVATAYAASTKEEATTVLQDYVDKNAAAVSRSGTALARSSSTSASVPSMMERPLPCTRSTRTARSRPRQ